VGEGISKFVLTAAKSAMMSVGGPLMAVGGPAIAAVAAGVGVISAAEEGAGSYFRGDSMGRVIASTSLGFLSGAKTGATSVFVSLNSVGKWTKLLVPAGGSTAETYIRARIAAQVKPESQLDSLKKAGGMGTLSIVSSLIGGQIKGMEQGMPREAATATLSTLTGGAASVIHGGTFGEGMQNGLTGYIAGKVGEKSAEVARDRYINMEKEEERYKGKAGTSTEETSSGEDKSHKPKIPGKDEEGAGKDGKLPKQPMETPSPFADDYKAMQKALARGDEAAADQYATRMLVKNYEKFKGMVAEGKIDPNTAQRAVRTHQEIVREGIKEGTERTKRMGDLLQDGKDGSVIKRTWAAGGGMDEFDPKKPKVSGDTDWSPIIDRNIAKQRGLDPDRVQKDMAGHTKDAINEIARKRLGEDIRDYYGKTKIKATPGSDEEYLSIDSHKTPGRVVGQERVKTTLGEEMGHPKWLDEAAAKTATGVAMQRADEHNLISHVIKEHPPTGNIYRDGETARELTKHLDREGKYSDNPRSFQNWTTQKVDKSKLHSPEGFEKVLEAARKGNPGEIKNALESDPKYKGDYGKFYKDIQESSKQGVQKALDQGGKVWEAQREGLKSAGVEVNDKRVIKHTTGPETKEEFSKRIGLESDLKELVPKTKTFKTENAEKLYESIKDREPPRTKEGKIDGWGNKPEPEVTNTREAAIARDNQRRGGEPDAEQLAARQHQEKIDALKEKDPVFRDLDSRVRQAMRDGSDRRYDEVKEMIQEDIAKEKKWGPPESKEFQKELGNKMSIDQRLQDPTTVKYQEHQLIQQGVTREQFEAWQKTKQQVERGGPMEPLKPFKEPDEKSWAPYKPGESPFRPDEPSMGNLRPEKPGPGPGYAPPDEDVSKPHLATPIPKTPLEPSPSPSAQKVSPPTGIQSAPPSNVQKPLGSQAILEGPETSSKGPEDFDRYREGISREHLNHDELGRIKLQKQELEGMEMGREEINKEWENIAKEREVIQREREELAREWEALRRKKLTDDET
jgi:hypothetical protein